MAGEQIPGRKDVFVFRYKYLLLEVGTHVLRRVFNNIVGNDFMRYLNTNRTQYNQLMSLINRDLTDAQRKFLPPEDIKPTSSNFDKSLLDLLLRNVCGLVDRRSSVWIVPAAGDFSVEADITRLRVCRNNLMHRGTVFMVKADLVIKWKELCQILIRLNSVAQIPNLPALIKDAEEMGSDEEENKVLEMEIGEFPLDLEATAGQSIFRYRYMVLDIGTNVLRQLIESKVGLDLGAYLKSLSVRQKTLLHAPPLEKYPDSSKFDLPFLTNLWRNVCGLLPSTNYVWQNPESTDMSMEADITRLCNCTNKMMHGNTFLPEKVLDTRIDDVRLILQRLCSGNTNLSRKIICGLRHPLDMLVPPDHSIRGNITNQPLEPQIPTKSLYRLTSLSLHGIKIEHKSFKMMVSFLSFNDLIQNINFSYVSCYHHQDNDTNCTMTLNLENNTKLTSLCLYGVNIVCERVNCFSLQSIKLYPISDRVCLSYFELFNCIKRSDLQHLDIHGSLARYEGNTLESLTSALKTLRNIKSLKLSGINLPNDVSLRLHHDVTQVKIVLEHVIMSKECFESFIINCVKAIYEVHVELYCCTITPVGDINSCFEEHETSANGATGISHLKSWQNTVRYIWEQYTAIPGVKVTHQDVCCLHFKSITRD